MTENTLQSLEEQLPPEFVRVSKSVIINSDYVKELHKYFRGKFIIVINDVDQTKIETSSSCRNNIVSRFNL